MADKKTGPVKPPILDMKARDAARSRPETEKPAPATADTKASESTEKTAPKTEKATPPPPSGVGPKPEPKTEPAPTTKPQAEGEGEKAGAGKTPPPSPPPPPAPPKRPDTAPDPQPGPNGFALGATALAGGVTGLVLAYGLALGGLWPQPEQGQNPDIVAGLEARIAALEALSAGGGTSESALAERLDALEMGLSETAAAIAALGEAAPASATTDFAGLADTVTALSERVDALGSAADGEAQPPATGEIEARLATLESQYQDALAQLDALAHASQSADDRLADLETRIADQSDFDALNAERERLVQLPGALSALETAIASGDAFANELSAVVALSPGLEPDPEAVAAAASGVKSPKTLLTEFRALIPDLIAARPDQAQSGWFDTLLDQASAAIALRPTGEDGDDAASLVGRTETALDAGDLARAREIIALYPPDMAAIAQPIDHDISAHIAARALLDAAQDPSNPSEVTQ